jgi:precorrin-6B methylase 2
MTESDLVTRVTWAATPQRTLHISASRMFPVTPYTRFLLSGLPTLTNMDVIDFGAGCGLIGMVAATLGASSVLAVDVSPDALALTTSNAERNGISSLRTLQVEPHHEAMTIPAQSADVILCNPASLPALVGADGFWSGGSLGNDMILALVDVAAIALRPRGTLRFVHTSLAAIAPTFNHLARQRFASGILQVAHVPFRPHYGPLIEHFAALRQRGQIYFDGNTIENSQELLYLVHAQRAP